MSKIFVGNIPHQFTDTDLANWISAAGFPVESAQIIMDRSTGNPRGFGFVLLQDQKSNAEAIKQLHGKRMAGRIITVNEAVPLSTERGDPGRDRGGVPQRGA